MDRQFVGIVYPHDDAHEYTFVDEQGNAVTIYWWGPIGTEDYVDSHEGLNGLGPEWVEMGYISEDGFDRTPQPDCHVTPMLYTGPLTVIPTGTFRIRPEDVTSTCGRTG